MEGLTIGYCFNNCFLEIFVGDKGGAQSRDMGCPPSPPHQGKPALSSLNFEKSFSGQLGQKNGIPSY